MALLLSNFCLIIHVRYLKKKLKVQRTIQFFSPTKGLCPHREENNGTLFLSRFLYSLKCRCVSQSTENLVPFETTTFVFHAMTMKHQFS